MLFAEKIIETAKKLVKESKEKYIQLNGSKSKFNLVKGLPEFKFTTKEINVKIYSSYSETIIS